jgi:glycosyltransferase involved in cell wall biosynthesis
MKKVLFVSTPADFIRIFLLPFARHFRNQGWQVDGMAAGISSRPVYKEYLDNTFEMDWSRNPLQSLSRFTQTVTKIKSIVEAGEYDLVHVHTPIAAFLTRLSIRELKTKKRPKVIYTAHGFHFHPAGNILKNRVFLELERLAGRWTDFLVVINHEDKIEAERYRIVDPLHIRYMPGIGVDTNLYRKENITLDAVEGVRQELSLAAGTPLFLMVAAFDRRKRHQDVLHAMARLERQDAHLAMAGGGTCLLEMKELAQRLNLQERVHFLGFREDVPTLNRAAVAMLLPSEQEGLPRSIMESLCLEVPCIGSNIRGTRDLLSDGCGILTEVGNVDAITEGMNRILAGPTEAREMGARGRRRMKDFDVGIILKLHEDLYEEALTGR